MNSGKLRVISFKLKVKNSLLLLFLLLTALLLLIAGCETMPPAPSDTHMKAIELNHKAERLFKKGDYEKALAFYNEALRINRSVENTDGIATNLINMTVIHRKLGNEEDAHRCVEEILNSHIPFNQSHLSEAAFMKATLYMDEGYFDYSFEWLNKALSFCKNTQCSIEGRVYNLKARIAFLKGDLNQVFTHGNKALELNRRLDDTQEVANSLRIIAEAKLSMNKYEEAKRLYEEALTIDKILGLDRKLALDLMGIGDALLKQGRPEEALKYFKRALSVSESSGDTVGATNAKKMLDKFF